MRILQGGLAAAAAATIIAMLSTSAVGARQTPSAVLAYAVSDNATVVKVVDRDGRATSQTIPVSRARLEVLVLLTWPGPSIPGDASVPTPERVPEALRFVTQRSGAAFASTGQELGAYRVLYELLIAPIRGSLPGRDSVLTIITDGPLRQLSFAALSNENGRALIEDYQLHYRLGETAPSPAPVAVPNARNTFLFVANPDSASHEVRAIVRAMRLINPQTLSGKGATTPAIRKAIVKARVAHFAGARAMDPPLTPAEIAGLHLTADLVVLGTPGEAWSRAFLSAGTRAVLTPLWDISEVGWEPLMARFYEEWQKSGDKIAALRVAQLSVLRDLREGRLKISTPAGDMVLPPHPLLWANAVLIGER